MGLLRGLWGLLTYLLSLPDPPSNGKSHEKENGKLVCLQFSACRDSNSRVYSKGHGYLGSS